MNKFDAIFKDLEAINNESIIDIHVPMAKKTKKFKPISVLQQKKIIGNIGNNPLDNIRIINALNSIITDNCCDDSSNDISTFDREFILLNLKAEEEETKEQIQEINAFTKTIDVEKLQQATATFGDVITVEMQLPTLQRDSDINNWFINSNKNVSHSASELASDYFVLEIVKHIKKLTIRNESVCFDDVADIGSYVKIAEQMPASVNNAVAKFITKAKDAIEQAFKGRNLDIQTPLF
jgi:hypothetical protein